ncbi:MAG: nuclear transport factor 2 family protein [Actinomycetota bacterium]|nr:nuclear transport factor 2 family protein [Actinomycetota bacterium]
MPAPPDREASDFDSIVEETRRGLHAIVRGDPGPMKSLFSHGDDVSLANPFGPPRLGRTEVENATEQAAANFEDGSLRCEEVSRYVTPELAYVVQLERAEAKVGGSEELSPISLRVTMIFRREGDGWRIVHRHADPITSPRPLESIIENQAGT